MSQTGQFLIGVALIEDLCYADHSKAKKSKEKKWILQIRNTSSPCHQQLINTKQTWLNNSTFAAILRINLSSYRVKVAQEGRRMSFMAYLLVQLRATALNRAR